MWKEIDDMTLGDGFDGFGDDAVCNRGVADWHGREGIRQNLREFIDKGVTKHQTFSNAVRATRRFAPESLTHRFISA